ncbi:MAG: PEP-CTERM sorting domain-containing protein [Methylococcales bacterium]|nr:PEP-CTERM sorting domain-containing protein [Methylococcales bacterium]
MFNQLKTKKALIALALGLSLAQSTQASIIDFDSIAAGSDASTDAVAVASGIAINTAVFLPNLDVDGIAISGTEHWQIDTFVATAENTSLQGWGTAPSGANALDARPQPILLSFSSPTDLGGFSFQLPDSTFGNPPPNDVLFLDAAGITLYDLAYNQGVALATVSLPTTLSGVSQILLPSGTFYDNINVAAVPVPGAIWLFGSAIMGFLGLRRNKKA